ncbi:hypothetical protein EST38_g3727 [Candolleomyces aberdarensis]|uniref:Uncharacterized protein n=1 Tax=Candolleomyces aberdarensis TaxID=2316362 RepID=A0A4Q2DTD9_9AGAR|nr:hypothetical protein EST38_g3727 [Candolleomyces aberdarensis]
MPWFWPQEGLPLPSHLPSIEQLHERLVGAALAASQPLLSAKPALAPLFCDLAKTLRMENLVALPCEIAPVVPVAVVEEIIHVATGTTSLSAISTLISPPQPIPPSVLPLADASTLLDYASPPDYLDLVIPYSLVFIWFIGMILLFAFSKSSGSLSRFKRTIREEASSSSTSHADKQDGDDRQASLDTRFEFELPSDKASDSPPASPSFFPIPSMTLAVGLLLLSYTVSGGPLPSDFASQLFGDVAETVQSVLPLAIKPALVNIFSDLAKTLRVDDLVPLACDLGVFVKDLVLEHMSSTEPDVFENLFLGYEDLINAYYPLMFILPLYLVSITIFLSSEAVGLTQIPHKQTSFGSHVDQEDRRSRYRQPSWSTHFETDYFEYPLPREELEPIVDEDSGAIPPDAIYMESHRYNIELVIFKVYRQRDNILVDERTHCELKSHRVDRVCSISCPPSPS